MISLEEVFEKYSDDGDEFLKFDRVENPLSTRPDLCAFLLLDKLLPLSNRDMISDASHDQIYLEVDCEELAKVATEEDIITLIRCGVILSEDYLYMFT